MLLLNHLKATENEGDFYDQVFVHFVSKSIKSSDRCRLSCSVITENNLYILSQIVIISYRKWWLWGNNQTDAGVCNAAYTKLTVVSFSYGQQCHVHLIAVVYVMYTEVAMYHVYSSSRLHSRKCFQSLQWETEIAAVWFRGKWVLKSTVTAAHKTKMMSKELDWAK